MHQCKRGWEVILREQCGNEKHSYTDRKSMAWQTYFFTNTSKMHNQCIFSIGLSFCKHSNVYIEFSKVSSDLGYLFLYALMAWQTLNFCKHKPNSWTLGYPSTLTFKVSRVILRFYFFILSWLDKHWNHKSIAQTVHILYWVILL